MPFFIVFLLTCTIAVLPAARAWADPPLRIASWNIAQLKYDAATDSGGKRSAADFDRLAGYAQQLDADIIALQEVQNEAAASRIFGPDYRIFLSSRRHSQRVGFAVRSSVVLEGPPQDVPSITGGARVRYGKDLGVVLGNGETLRLLAVHLKSFCHEKPLDTDVHHCEKLARQAAPIEAWIDARARADQPFIVLGDFNRRFDVETPSANGETFWDLIDDHDPPRQDLTRVTQFRISECYDRHYPEYIDHIILGPEAARRVVLGSFRQVQYAEPFSESAKISDHCPISIDLTP